MPAQANYTVEEYLAAYARLVAEGDRAGCARLRKEMAERFGSIEPRPRSFSELARVFADGTNHEALAAGLSMLSTPQHAITRLGGNHPSADHIFRGQLADLLDDHDRPEEAGLLRDPKRHVMVHGDRVVPARYTDRHLWDSLDGVHKAHEGRSVEDGTPFIWGGDNRVTGLGRVRLIDTTARYGEHIANLHISQLGPHLAEAVRRKNGPHYQRWHPDGPQPPHTSPADVEKALEGLRTAPFEEPAPPGSPYPAPALPRRTFADGTNHEALSAGLSILASPEHTFTRRGGAHLEADHVFRGQLADLLQDHDRHDEANLLRNPNKHVMVHPQTGAVVPARYSDRHVVAALQRADDAMRGPGGRKFEDNPPHFIQWTWGRRGTLKVRHAPSTGRGPATDVELHASEFGPYFARLYRQAGAGLLTPRHANLAPGLSEAIGALHAAPFEVPATEPAPALVGGHFSDARDGLSGGSLYRGGDGRLVLQSLSD